ncbi:MAG: anthranilate synthase component I family protein [Pyrinomonadaceae bacterium]
MRRIDVSADEIVSALLRQPSERGVSLLDSCGVGRRGSNLLIAGIDPISVSRITHKDADLSLKAFETELGRTDLAAMFTISYDFGAKLNRISPGPMTAEPDIYLGLYRNLVIHDYDTHSSFVCGPPEAFDRDLLTVKSGSVRPVSGGPRPFARSNFTREAYLRGVEGIQELIRSGETYQTNLTQQFRVPVVDSPVDIFERLRSDHPAPFAAFIDRGDSTVVSASPEQFLRVERSTDGATISSLPIKGTRRRGTTASEDDRLRTELLSSLKDRAENTMIVDLMRNDLGRICEFGSVKVDELCRIETHPSLFHLVSKVAGKLKRDIGYADILRSAFPAGSITGAPKIRTMKIIDELENCPRGLSMGAIGCRIPAAWASAHEVFEMSVAIRTMVIREDKAVFNVGGGVVIDSDPVNEYDESLLKAKALFRALGLKEPAATRDLTADRK